MFFHGHDTGNIALILAAANRGEEKGMDTQRESNQVLTGLKEIDLRAAHGVSALCECAGLNGNGLVILIYGKAAVIEECAQKTDKPTAQQCIGDGGGGGWNAKSEAARELLILITNQSIE